MDREESTVESTPLLPVIRPWWRLALLMPMWVLACIGTQPWTMKLGFILLTLLAFGTYRKFSLSKKYLRHQWAVGFYQLPARKWKLRRFSKIETHYERPAGLVEFLLLGPTSFIYGWLTDRLFPWVGGAYTIWLNNY